MVRKHLDFSNTVILPNALPSIKTLSCSGTRHRWNYVITGVLEVDVKPRLQMWSWQHIRRHRQTVKNYRELYKEKITSKKPSEELLKALEVGQG